MSLGIRARVFSFGAVVFLNAACLLFHPPAHGGEPSEVPVIDVLLVYTPAAMLDARSVPPAQRLVDEANSVFLNSNARARLRLVHMAKVAYVEPSFNDSYQLQQTLDHLTDPQDGYLDEVHALRAQYGADVVVLVAKDVADSDGFLAPLRPDAAHAFGVLTSTYPGDYAFTRLMGRLLGCEAQRAPLEETWRVVGEGAFVDSHACVITNWQNYVCSTIMGARLNLIPFFSNPELTCFGSPLGIAGAADNVRTINLVAPEIAAFRGTNNSVNPPQVQWQSPAAGSLLLPGTDIRLQVTATSSTGAIQTMDFYQAGSYYELNPGVLLTNGSSDPAERFGRTLTNAAPGWYRIAARATDDQGNSGQAAIEFRVRAQNDDFTNRIPLRSSTDRVPVDLRGMTLEPGEAALAPPGVEATAWYTWTAPDEGFLQAQAFAKSSWSSLSPLVRAYYGAELASLTPSGVNPDRNSALILRVHRGETIQLSVGCARTEAVSAELDTDFLPLLANDSFETRVPVAGPAVMIAGHNVAARSATNAVWQSPPGPTVWWAWTPSVTGIAQIQASNFVWSHELTVFQGDRPETLSWLAQLSPSYDGTVSHGFPVRAGQPLPVAVTSPTGYPTGAFAFRLAVLPGAPNITFSNRLSRTGSHWIEPLLFPAESAAGAPAGVGPYATWWEWTAPQSGTVMLTINGWSAPKVFVFTGNSLTSLQIVPTLQSGVGLATFAVTAGANYQLALSWDSIPYYLGAGYAPVLHLGYAAANDNFSQRMVLSGTPVEWDLTTAYGTRETGEPDSPLASWWYSWTAPARGRVTLSATGQVGLAVFRGSVVGQLTNVPFQQYWTDPSSFVAEPGVEYQLAVRTSSLDRLPVSAHLRLDFQPSPANDEFAARQLLNGSDYAMAADLAVATANPTDPVIPNSGTKPRTLWWRWVVPADGLANISTSSSYLGVYRGNSVGTLTPVIYCQGYGPTILGVKAGDVLELMLAGDGSYRASFQVKLLPLGGNDWFFGRTALGANGGNPLALRQSDGNTQGATREAGEKLSSTNAVGHSRWWTWNTPVPAIAKVLVSPATGRVFAEQFRGSQLASLGSVAWQEASWVTLRFHADPGIEYPLAVDTAGTNDFSYSISVDLTPDAPVPANDLFQQAQVLNGPAAKVQGTHRTATAEPGEPAHGGLTPARSLWFRWTALHTGRVRLWAKPISLDAATPVESYPGGTLAQPHRPGLGVYLGTTLDSLLAQPCQSLPSTNAYESAVEFDAVAGQNYALALEGGTASDADVGEFELQLLQLPTNDDFANRIPLQGPVALLSGTVFGATRATNEWVAQWPSSLPRPNLMNVWWEWTAPADLRVTLRNVRSNEHFWGVWRGGDTLRLPPRCSVMDRYFGWEDTRRDFVARAGEVWYIAVYADPVNKTPVEMELEGVPVPVNDNFADRLSLTGERVSVSARADNTSRESDEPPHGLGTVGLPYGKATNAPSLWWSWTAPRSGLFALTTEPQAALRPQLTGFWDQVARADCFVYQGDQITSLSKLAGTGPETTSPPSGIKRVTFAAAAGATYQIALCPIFVEKRVWETAKKFVNLSIDPVAENSSSDAAWQLTGSAPAFSGNLRSAVDSLWWRWTAPQSGTFDFAQRLGGADLTRQVLIQVYRRDPTTGDLILLDSNTAQAGETYWLKVSVQLLNWWETPPTWDGRDLPFEAALGLTRQATNNDNFAQRELLTGEVAVLMGDTTSATREAGEPVHAGALGRGSLWWQWTAPHSGRWTLAPLIAWWRPILIDVYRGNTLSTLERVPTERNTLRGDVLFQAQAGESYAIAIDNPSYVTGSFEVDLIQYLPPANDSFAGRILLDRPAPVWTARNFGASAEPGEPNHAGCAPGASTWWTWTAQNSNPVLLSVKAGDSTTWWGPPRLAVYRGNSLQSLIPVGNNRVGGELVSNLTFQAQAGVSYAFALDTLPEEVGAFQLTLTSTNAPLNDDFARRLTLAGSQVQASGFNYAATLEPGEPNLPEAQVDATLWWSWRAPGSGPALIDTSGSDFDTAMAVYQGSSLASLHLVSQNDDIGAMSDGTINFASRLAFNVQGGVTYHIQVGGVAGQRGRVALTLQGPNAPPAQLLAAEVANGGGLVQLRLYGTPGQTVWVQASSDLLNWEWAGSLQFVSANAVWTEPIAPGAAARFYRLVSPQ